MPLVETPAVSSTHRAVRLLSAWVSRDPGGLHEELRKSLEREALPVARSWEEEDRIQLLRAVATGIQQSPAGDPKLRCCVDLLRHLAEMR